MFEFVRTHTRLFQFILVILIFPSFVFFGVQGYSSFRDAANADVAKVDGRSITRAEWDQAHQRNVERLRRQMPGVDVKLLDSPEARRESLDALVRERVLLAVAQKQHLLPADERLRRLFTTDPQYQGLRNADGSVNKDILAAQGMTSEMFAQNLRLELGMRQVLGGIGGSATASKAVVSNALDALLQRREVQLQRFEPQVYAAKLQPTEAELASYFQSNQARFRLPEEAAIEYVVLDLASIQKGVTVSDDELKKYFDENASRYTVAEERRARHILVKADRDLPAAERQKAKARAEALLAEARKAPASFAELARKNSDDVGSAANGGDLDFFGRGAMVKAFEDAVFSLKPGEISPVVESDFGFHVIQLEAVRGGAKKPFEAVRGEIEAEVRRTLAQRRYAETAEQFTNTVYEQSDSLQAVVDKLKLEKKTAMVQRTPPPGAAGALASAKLLEAVFSNDAVVNKRNTEAIDLGNNQLAAARVVKHTPARVPPLGDVKDQVRTAVVAQQAAALARRDGEALVAKARASADVPLAQTAVVSRSQPQNLPRQALQAVLQADAGQLPAVVGIDLGEQGFVVARVTKVLPPEDAAAALQALAPQYAQAWGNAEAAAYYEALKRRHGVSLKPAALAASAAAR